MKIGGLKGALAAHPLLTQTLKEASYDLRQEALYPQGILASVPIEIRLLALKACIDGKLPKAEARVITRWKERGESEKLVELVWGIIRPRLVKRIDRATRRYAEASWWHQEAPFDWTPWQGFRLKVGKPKPDPYPKGNPTHPQVDKPREPSDELRAAATSWMAWREATRWLPHKAQGWQALTVIFGSPMTG